MIKTVIYRQQDRENKAVRQWEVTLWSVQVHSFHPAGNSHLPEVPVSHGYDWWPRGVRGVMWGGAPLLRHPCSCYGVQTIMCGKPGVANNLFTLSNSVKKIHLLNPEPFITPTCSAEHCKSESQETCQELVQVTFQPKIKLNKWVVLKYNVIKPTKIFCNFMAIISLGFFVVVAIPIIYQCWFFIMVITKYCNTMFYLLAQIKSSPSNTTNDKARHFLIMCHFLLYIQIYEFQAF